MSMREDAKLNLEMAGLFDKNSDYGGMLGEAVLRLVNTHFNERHSGNSHEMVLDIFSKVARGHALTAKFWDHKKAELDKFAMENMGEPWEEHSIIEMIGERPNEQT